MEMSCLRVEKLAQEAARLPREKQAPVAHHLQWVEKLAGAEVHRQSVEESRSLRIHVSTPGGSVALARKTATALMREASA